ncbi:hypothetical protein DPEC_G00153650 [Dallia pectoralis]|uniref:Uncharacterized protein n=1 Tax=Dallia pectoralis TaxID=75939 RepID=A0ACC2GJK0_DALPE|nr:hypothetical protein DPEC_G00153650 [Dallia pectoralis]
MDWESTVKKLSSIKEDEEGSDNRNSALPKLSRTPLGLGRGFSSPLRSPLRSPLLPPRGPFRTPTDRQTQRPSNLNIPVVSFTCLPPDLSPRFVDGIETDSGRSLGQKFDFSPSVTQLYPPNPNPGIPTDSDTMQTIATLKVEMTGLSHQVSQVVRDLQEMTQLLRPLLQPLLQCSSQSVLSSLMAALTPPTAGSHAPLPTPHPSDPASACVKDPEMWRERRHSEPDLKTPYGRVPYIHSTPTGPVQLSFIDEERPVI